MFLKGHLREELKASLYCSFGARVSFPNASIEAYGGVLQIEVIIISELSIEGAFELADERSVEEKAKSWAQKSGFGS